MVLQIHIEKVPLKVISDEVVYVGNTRVPLETVIFTFNEGNTPEEIVMQYPALHLADVYQVIGYYLQHRDEIDAYVDQAQQHHDQVKLENQSRFDTRDLRERLLSRRDASS